MPLPGYKRQMGQDKLMVEFAPLVCTNRLMASTGLSAAGIEELQTELSQHPIYEMLKLDQKPPQDIVQECSAYIEALRSNVQGSVWTHLEHPGLNQCSIR